MSVSVESHDVISGWIRIERDDGWWLAAGRPELKSTTRLGLAIEFAVLDGLSLDKTRLIRRVIPITKFAQIVAITSILRPRRFICGADYAGGVHLMTVKAAVSAAQRSLSASD